MGVRKPETRNPRLIVITRRVCAHKGHPVHHGFRYSAHTEPCSNELVWGFWASGLGHSVGLRFARYVRSRGLRVQVSPTLSAYAIQDALRHVYIHVGVTSFSLK